MTTQAFQAPAINNFFNHLPVLSKRSGQTSPQKTRRHYNCIAILWLRGKFDATETEAVIQRLERLSGVRSAQIARQTPVLLKISYSRADTQVAQIVKTMALAGKTLRQVGC